MTALAQVCGLALTALSLLGPLPRLVRVIVVQILHLSAWYSKKDCVQMTDGAGMHKHCDALHMSEALMGG